MEGTFVGGGTSLTLCGASTARQTSCTAGCAREGAFEVMFPLTGPIDTSTLSLLGHPAALCAETPEVQPGDVCHDGWSFPSSNTGVKRMTDAAVPCAPTRAKLAADGTVERNIRLACDPTEHCLDVTDTIAEDVPFAACDPAVVAELGTPNVNGVVAMAFGASACLLAWDDVAQVARSGRARPCVGDWQCGPHSLCDDQLVLLGTTMPPIAVCKPGPRGVLTPAMLSP
ncbi:MAG TPA: hypothetical protein VFQ53_00730 [Kofleriaceae bacterium]|nr:hypothetical protein [Kofleriaceae bacterium]